MRNALLLFLLMPMLVIAHGGAIDNQGGHFSRQDNTYHCHKEPCFTIHEQADEAYRQAKPGTFNRLYNRKDWPHWIDADGDCQDTRQELLIANSRVPVQFKNHKHCTVTQGHWYGAYTGKIFTKASDVDIDHIVPLAHAHRYGAANWTKAQRREFANDFENLLVVDDATNQAKSDKAPHEWLPPQQDYWCEYRKKWMHIKDKYQLRYGNKEGETLSALASACR